MSAHTWHLHSRVAPVGGERVIAKTASDSFHETALLDELRRLGVNLVSDPHTTVDAAFPAELIIRHHNAVLPRLAHPSHHITVRPSREVSFGEGDRG